MSEKVRDRCQGVLIGLAAGDRNGGPIRLAIRLTETLLQNKSFDQKQIVETYFNYFRGRVGPADMDGGPPHDTEKAFDTGHTFYSVFKNYSKGMKLAEASQSVQEKFGSIGIGAAHRNVVLSSLPFITDLKTACLEETYITHANLISFEVSHFVNNLCRILIQNENESDWNSCIEKALTLSDLKEAKVIQGIKLSKTCSIGELSSDGYAPNVLQASMYFLHNHQDSFQECLKASLAFAGSANFCPVLVGAIAGARFGAKSILSKDLSHCSSDLRKRVTDLGEKVADLW